jgi:hypothetical protein
VCSVPRAIRAQSFHLSSGIQGHTRFRMRKALRLWVSRAHTRKGLRKQIFTSALKGKDLLRLMNMADDVDTDDLANAMLAKDAEGCTPLLCAAVRGCPRERAVAPFATSTSCASARSRLERLCAWVARRSVGSST